MVPAQAYDPRRSVNTAFTTRRTSWFIAVALACLVAPVSAQKVKIDVDRSVSFAPFTTYYWLKTNPGGDLLMDQRITSAVDQWLTVKGWTKVPEADADIAVAPHVSLDQGQTLNTFYEGWGSSWAYAGFSGYGASRTAGNPVRPGTLMIDLFIRQTRQLIWRGTAVDALTNDKKNAGARIQKAVEKMFKRNFPPT
jgi:uncharacterized protein DUF4136